MLQDKNRFQFLLIGLVFHRPTHIHEQVDLLDQVTMTRERFHKDFIKTNIIWFANL